ncbi:LAGLIDADG family homing endonuclease [Streptomyces caniscabiei]|nr:LAGLIDADG family homing endonuclease [Streptomyces caniscabiei]MDX2606575.1 LAGLIDADG family homing endonuclease [Streptomyces caniscabiei]MDX2739513.1 LAGLIDADG family homing endonuclease [Streptomyces caniscabiei]MDX2782575.1 LAGLIDADG family homing endonuclease [Streptomyces caniscabiei]
MADREPSAHTFMDLRIPEYAYMFGFLQMDGHLEQGAGQKGRLTVEINARDIDILRHFRDLTPYYSNITERARSTNFAETHHSATWSLYSLEARKRLSELGLLHGRKSKRIAPPRGDFSRRDYLRGIIDADGSVGRTSQGFPFISLATASTAIAAYLCFYARQLTGAERTLKRNARDGIYNVLYTKEDAKELAAHFYYENCLSLSRKQAAATSLTAWVRPAGMKLAPYRRRWKEWEDRALLQADDVASAAEQLGRPQQSCSMRLWRLRTGRVPMPSNEQ